MERIEFEGCGGAPRGHKDEECLIRAVRNPQLSRRAARQHGGVGRTGEGDL